jgi:hypothetical protein
MKKTKLNEEQLKAQLLNFMLEKSIILSDQLKSGNLNLMGWIKDYESNLLGLDEFNEKLKDLESSQNQIRGKMDILNEINEKFLG